MGVIFSSGRIFIGNGEILENGSVRIEDGRIAGVAAGSLAASSGDEVISLEGRTLLPGFIDCHVHLCMDQSLDTFGALAGKPDGLVALETAVHARRTLLSGVTSVRDLGAKNGVDLVIRDAIQSGLVPGPRMQAAGSMICMTGGHGWTIGVEVDGPDGVSRAVRGELKRGADVLKFMATGGVLTAGVEPGSAQLTEEEMSAGVLEAHKAGRKTAAHAQGASGILNAVQAGIDTIEHGFFLDRQTAALMKHRGAAFVPTLSIYTAGDRAVRAGLPEEIVERHLSARREHLASVRLAREAGVTVALGTDAGTAFNLHGENLTELKHLVALGFSPMEALQAGTLTAARVLGWENEVGSMEEGKLADLVVVEGNPLEDVALMLEKENLAWVMKGGLAVVAEGRVRI